MVPLIPISWPCCLCIIPFLWMWTGTRDCLQQTGFGKSTGMSLPRSGYKEMVSPVLHTRACSLWWDWVLCCELLCGETCVAGSWGRLLAVRSAARRELNPADSQVSKLGGGSCPRGAYGWDLSPGATLTAVNPWDGGTPHSGSWNPEAQKQSEVCCLKLEYLVTQR